MSDPQADGIGGGGPTLDELVMVLHRERQVLEGMLFRLVEARGLLATGEARFLSWAAADLEQAAASVREVEVRRTSVLPPCLDGEGPATLRGLARRTSEPIASILEDHRVGLGRLAGEVGAATEATQELAAEGLCRARASDLELASAGTAESDDRGRRAAHEPLQHRRPRPQPQPQDELDLEILSAGYEAVLAASARLALPSLVAFLA
ncbi:MAG TPA: hypothetical protein VMN58_03820 [Acidimicrobiales bacterium]|nr:hypothetical protein [Acidimicrobiales bacterium]